MANCKKNFLEGQRFGRLLVLNREGKDIRNCSRWRVLCDCGAIKFVLGKNLKAGLTKSCGCLHLETLKKNSDKGTNLKHGHSKKGNHSPEYNSWEAMWTRCSNPRTKASKYYFEKGVSVCDRWKSFENFLADMGSRPKGKSLHRINSDDNYRPENCCWATAKEQSIYAAKRRNNYASL